MEEILHIWKICRTSHKPHRAPYWPPGAAVHIQGQAVHQGWRFRTAGSQFQSAIDSDPSSHSETGPTPQWHGQNSYTPKQETDIVMPCYPQY